MMQMLIEHGALVTQGDVKGRTAWYLAAAVGNTSALEGLFALGVESKKTALVPGHDGFIPLFCAAKHSQVKACKWFISNIEELTLSSLNCPDGL